MPATLPLAACVKDGIASGSKCRGEALSLCSRLPILSPLQFGGWKIRSGLSVIADAPKGGKTVVRAAAGGTLSQRMRNP